MLSTWRMGGGKGGSSATLCYINENGEKIHLIAYGGGGGGGGGGESSNNKPGIRLPNEPYLQWEHNINNSPFNKDFIQGITFTNVVSRGIFQGGCGGEGG